MYSQAEQKNREKKKNKRHPPLNFRTVFVLFSLFVLFFLFNPLLLNQHIHTSLKYLFPLPPHTPFPAFLSPFLHESLAPPGGYDNTRRSYKWLWSGEISNGQAVSWRNHNVCVNCYRASWGLTGWFHSSLTFLMREQQQPNTGQPTNVAEPQDSQTPSWEAGNQSHENSCTLGRPWHIHTSVPTQILKLLVSIDR